MEDQTETIYQSRAVRGECTGGSLSSHLEVRGNILDNEDSFQVLMIQTTEQIQVSNCQIVLPNKSIHIYPWLKQGKVAQLETSLMLSFIIQRKDPDNHIHVKGKDN